MQLVKDLVIAAAIVKQQAHTVHFCWRVIATVEWCLACMQLISYRAVVHSKTDEQPVCVWVVGRLEWQGQSPVS